MAVVPIGYAATSSEGPQKEPLAMKVRYLDLIRHRIGHSLEGGVAGTYCKDRDSRSPRSRGQVSRVPGKSELF